MLSYGWFSNYFSMVERKYEVGVWESISLLYDIDPWKVNINTKAG